MSVPAVPDGGTLADHEPELRSALAAFLDHHLRDLKAVLADVEARAGCAAVRR